MPTITAAEIAIVAAAVLLIYAAPVFLALLERFRRRAPRQWAGSPIEPVAAAVDAFATIGTTPVAAAPDARPPGAVQIEDAELSAGTPEPMAGSAATPLQNHLSESCATAAKPAPPPVGSVAAAAVESAGAADETVAVVAPHSDAGRYAGYEPPAVSPFNGSDGHRFRIADLHRARLTDWPPDSVHGDPARHRLWGEATRLAVAHDAAISATDLVAPCPVRSTCLGACERRPAGLTLHFLLFSELWPVAPEQAAARAVFEIDAGTAAIRHSLDILQPSA